MEDLETNPIFSRQEIDPQPQVVRRRELLPPNWHLRGRPGRLAQLPHQAGSWAAGPCGRSQAWERPRQAGVSSREATCAALGRLCPVRPGIRGFTGRSPGRIGVSLYPCQGLRPHDSPTQHPPWGPALFSHTSELPSRGLATNALCGIYRRKQSQALCGVLEL